MVGLNNLYDFSTQFRLCAFFVPLVPSVSLSQGRDTRDSETLSRQWDSLDEPFFVAVNVWECNGFASGKDGEFFLGEL